MPEIGNPSPLRLVEPILGSQVSWLLPLAILGLIVAARQVQPRLPLSNRGQSLLLWGTWLATTGIFFSVSRFYHLYYLSMFAPPIAISWGSGYPHCGAPTITGRRGDNGLWPWLAAGYYRLHCWRRPRYRHTT